MVFTCRFVVCRLRLHSRLQCPYTISVVSFFFVSLSVGILYKPSARKLWLTVYRAQALLFKKVWRDQGRMLHGDLRKMPIFEILMTLRRCFVFFSNL